MFWYSALLKEEFVNYFKDEDAIYFTASSKGKLYNNIYLEFNNTVQHLLVFFNSNKFEESLYYKIDDKESYLYKLAESFYKDEKRPNFEEIYHSIQGNMFNCNIDELSADQLAVGLMFPFASRMGGSFEDEFAESGRLRQFVLALYNKSLILGGKNVKENKMKSERLDEIYSVRIDGRNINIPSFCTCCMKPTDKREEIHYSVVESSVVKKETKTIKIEMPICDECAKHERRYNNLALLMLLFSVACGVAFGIFFIKSSFYDDLMMIVAPGAISVLVFIALSLLIKTKELPQHHTARRNSVKLTSPFLALGLQADIVIFTFTNLTYAKLFREANMSVAGDITVNQKINTAKSIRFFHCGKLSAGNIFLIVLLTQIALIIIARFI